MKRSKVPPTVKRPSHRGRGKERPQIPFIFASELRVGAEFRGTLVARIVDYDGATREPRGYKYHLELEDGPVLLYGTGLLDYHLARYEPGAELHIVYQGMSEIISGPNEGELGHQWRVAPLDSRPGKVVKERR